MGSKALEAQGLSKTFRVKRKQPGLSGSLRSLVKAQWEEKTAVAGIDLSVDHGETVAFLGPNGAGKSTTIKILTGILHPTSGRAQVLGCTPWKERSQLAFKIGAVFGQKSQLWYHLPALDTFELMARIYEIPARDYTKRRDDLIERFELGPYLHTPVRKLSLGERMRCEIAASFLHRPQLLFLDEPTIGLDVVVKQRIRELIRQLNKEEGTTVFLTSHDAGDVESLCSRAIVIHHGGILLDSPIERLKRDVLSRKTITLALGQDIRLIRRQLYETEGTTVLQADGKLLKLEVDLQVIGIDAALGRLIGNVPFSDVTVEDPALEEIIQHIYSLRSHTAASAGQSRPEAAGVKG